MSEQKPFSGALTSNRLIGRQAELDAIRKAVLSPQEDTGFYTVLVKAEGGYGKTRLLGAVEEQCSSKQVVVLPVIDMADPALHNGVDFLTYIRNCLIDRYPDDAARAAFSSFDKRTQEYAMSMFREVTFSQSARLATEIVKEFAVAYKWLTRHVRIVWLLDTMEQLVALPPDIEALIDIERQALDEWITPSTYRWIEMLISAPKMNTTLILSGRPAPSRWVARIKTILSEVVSMQTMLPDPNSAQTAAPIELTLDHFQLSEIRQYLIVLAEQLQADSELAQTAIMLQALSEQDDLLEILHGLTQGRPIRLGLYIDLLCNGGSVPAAFQRPFRPLPTDEQALGELRNSVDDELLNYIGSQVGGDAGQVLQYLTVSRRGLDAPRLVNLWYGFAQVDDPTALAEAESILHYLDQLSFVKQRHGRYFLHDEFYTLYQQRFTRLEPAFQQAERDEQVQFFERMVAYCQQAIRPLIEQLAVLRDTVRGPTDHEDDELQTSSELRGLLTRRRELQAELVHYALYLDPQTCINTTWFELSAQALSSEDLLMDVQIRSEVDLFFFGIRPDLNRQQVGLSEEDWELLRLAVVDTRISSIIRSYMSVGEYVRATNFYQMVEMDHPALIAKHYPSIHAIAQSEAGLQLHEWFRKEWAAFRWTAAIYLSGQKAKDGIAQLEAIDHYYQQQGLEQRSAKIGMFAERFRGVWTQIIMYIGYGYVTFNDFHRAMIAYRRALTILRPTKFKALPAEVKNNLSRVLGEIGAIDEAISLSDQVIATRRELGFDYLLAIAFNTRSLIRTRDDRPQTARILAARARDVFRRQGRGLGLAYTQYAEATRKWWNSTLDEARVTGLASFQGNIGELDIAAEGLQEALQIFGVHQDALDDLLGSTDPLSFEQQELIIKKLIREVPPPEPLRIVEALLEIACLHRDQLDALTNNLNHSSNYHRSERFFQIALLTANYYILPRHRLSAWIDLAWLYRRHEQIFEARQVLQAAMNDIPPDYWISTTGPLQANLTDIVYFRELSELWALRAELIVLPPGRIRADEAKELLAYRIIALIYIELFSPKHETSYLKVNRKQLRLLLEKLITDEYSTTTLRSYVIDIQSRYHLDSLRVHGRFVYQDVVDQLLGIDEQ